MGRPNNRALALQAAIQVAGEAGIQAVSYDSVATHAGMTKGGVMYHFPTKEELIAAVVDEIVDRWDARAARHLEGSFESASRSDRIAAFIRATAEAEATSAELAIFVGAMHQDHVKRAWRALRQRWVGDTAELTRGQHLALLAADGLWIDGISEQLPFPTEDRRIVVELLIDLVNGALLR